MPVSDPIADMLTRIRNAIRAGQAATIVQSSGMILGVAEVLLREGFISGFEIVERPVQNDVRVHLKYGKKGESVIRKIARESKPGRRLYRGHRDLKPLFRGMGCYILSTPKGILSDREARTARVGGEVLCSVY